MRDPAVHENKQGQNRGCRSFFSGQDQTDLAQKCQYEQCGCDEIQLPVHVDITSGQQAWSLYKVY